MGSIKRRSAYILLLAAGVAWAAQGDFQLGMAAYESGDYGEALAQWLPLAGRGHAQAQYRIGRLYFYGRGVEQDISEAAEWYRKAAEQGHARSQSNLAIMYEEGSGLPRDDEQAARWYAKAAEQGRAVSQNNLGRMYEEGRGVPQDEERAAELYARAARQGHAEAQYRLGRMYEEGRGVPADSKKAEKWLRKAAKNGYAAAQLPTGPPQKQVVAREGAWVEIEIDDEFDRGLERDLDTGSIPAGAAAATAGDFDAGLAAHERGDYATAAREWQPLAEAGDAEAQFRLGTLYRLGQGLPEDRTAAGRWYLEAAQQGHPMAMYYLGFMYLRGRGVAKDKDLARACVWFSLAAEHGVGDAAQWVDRVTRKMTEAEISAAKAELRERRE
jgi:TPR repeat protein